jgi:hypothetical protein
MEQRDHLKLSDAAVPARQASLQQRLFKQFGLRHEALFNGVDLTAGTENELAAAVVGSRTSADLPRRLLDSPHTGTLAPVARRALAQWLGEDPEQTWEHSWLRIARGRLHPAARAQLERDLAGRTDRIDFEIGADTVRLPASYVLRLAFTDACASLSLPASLNAVATQVADCFLNDNTAPEIISTHIVSGHSGRIGEAVAGENAQRFLLTQLLAAYANRHFGLDHDGQQLVVYGAPNPPARLRQLSRLLPADQYRELVMNPCLAGFRDGQKKRRYMHLCHETLSRGRQHAEARLIGAGIGRMTVIERLVCDTSLLNNGTHLSLGSRALGQAFAAPGGAQAEKYLGDLASKLIEHFLPLFVGTYSAAPARLAPADLKPERALGFLPNELSAPFLRLTWASWKRKAGLFAALTGDFVPDARLLDYFAALPSLPGRAALDGVPGNGERLKAALAAQGLYNADMTVYALYRLRELARMGFSGFEGRHYSLFASFADDLAPAAELQALVTAHAYRQVAAGEVTHAQIPDDPETESERRQLFFASAIGLPVAYVRRHTRNHFLLRILRGTRRTRVSKRHSQYFKVYLDDYREALMRVLQADGAALLDSTRRETLDDLRARLAQPEARSAAGVMTRGILSGLGAKSTAEAEAGAFNSAAERYYRDTLRRQQLLEGIDTHRRLLTATVATAARRRDASTLAAVGSLTGGRSLEQFFALTARMVAQESAEPATLRSWIGLVLVQIAGAQEA